MDLDKIFAPDTIIAYNPALPSTSVSHEFVPERRGSDGKPYDFQRVLELMKSLRSDVGERYTRETGQEFNTFKLGERINDVRQQFWNDQRFTEAFSLLGLEHSDREKAVIPWWSEVAAGELGYHRTKEGIHVTFGPRHSLETQLMRKGVERPVKNVSVGGLIFTAPEHDAPDGYVAIGIRGGASYSNTYHLNAGALSATPEFKEGKKSMYDLFVDKELVPEFNIAPEQVVSTGLISRIMDYTGDMGPMYVFGVRTSLNRDELTQQWKKNLDPDKQEHDSPFFIPNDPKAIWEFTKEHYRTVVQSKDGRPDSERWLLHPCGQVFAAHCAKNAEELRALYKEGTW